MTTFPPESARKKLRNPQSRYLNPSVTPAITNGADLLETLAFQHMRIVDQSGGCPRRACDPSEEILDFLLGLVIFGGILFDGERVPLPKEIWHEDLSPYSLGKDIGSLQSLREVARFSGRHPRDT